MPRPPAIIRNVRKLRETVAAWRAKRQTIALVPTMGALHDGHLALVQKAQSRADRVVVSIFVNPAQFAPTEDLESYPRTWTSDIAALRALKVDAVWAPSAAVMYPEGFATRIAPQGAALQKLEDAARPHFFGGVATVVGKLFTQVTPDYALFGEKDYQQLKVVTRMARDLDLPVTVVPVATVRERDGLAMSSRNFYLTTDQRKAAPLLHRVLKDCARAIAGGEQIDATLIGGRNRITQGGFALDYLEARDAGTLAPLTLSPAGAMRLLVAAKIGTTRLIDNVAVPRGKKR